MTFAIANFAPAGNNSKGLSGVGTATLTGAPSLYTYATADAVNTVSASGYFNDVASIINVGDFIFAVCVAGSGGTPAPTIFQVNANDGTTVDVSDGTGVSVTDTY